MGVSDHLAPGDGEVDFLEVNKYLGQNTTKVLELGPAVSYDGVKKGIECLNRLGIN